ncbi:MAG: hypothetical protein IJP43_07685 [Oscillospiraceae bacterium]|nr:hypothetical protein [Oscillospiraceae bacterium]
MSREPKIIAENLKRCSDYGKSCKGCTYKDRPFCESKLMRDAAVLINELTKPQNPTLGRTTDGEIVSRNN